MADTYVKIDREKLVRYLTVALKQRKRALDKFVSDYGPSSSSVAEINVELAELNNAIATLSVTSPAKK